MLFTIKSAISSIRMSRQLMMKSSNLFEPPYSGCSLSQMNTTSSSLVYHCLKNIICKCLEYLVMLFYDKSCIYLSKIISNTPLLFCVTKTGPHSKFENLHHFLSAKLWQRKDATLNAIFIIFLLLSLFIPVN